MRDGSFVHTVLGGSDNRFPSPLRTRTKSRFCVGTAEEIGLSNEDLGVSTRPCKGLGNNGPPACQRQH